MVFSNSNSVSFSLDFRSEFSFSKTRTWACSAAISLQNLVLACEVDLLSLMWSRIMGYDAKQLLKLWSKGVRIEGRWRKLAFKGLLHGHLPRAGYPPNIQRTSGLLSVGCPPCQWPDLQRCDQDVISDLTNSTMGLLFVDLPIVLILAQ
jgi:hypothetical protein